MLSPRLLSALALALISGCAAAPPKPEMPSQQQIAAPPRPAVLERSLFAKDNQGSLSEADLQRILEAPIDLQFPARVGVVPLAAPFDPQAEVTIHTRSVAAESLAKGIVRSPHFSHVTDISTDLPNVGGLEGLRVLAARYRLRYLLLYSERFVDDTHLNGWAWLYPTVLGMFLAPGVTVESSGIAQVHMLDVRTGTVLFSVVEPMHVAEAEWMVGAARAHRSAQAEAAAAAAERLAQRITGKTEQLIAWSDDALSQRKARTRVLPPPVERLDGSGSATAEAISSAQ